MSGSSLFGSLAMGILRNKKLLWVGPTPDPNIMAAFTARNYEVEHWSYTSFCHYGDEVIKAICQASMVFFVHHAQKQAWTFEFINRICMVPVSYSGTFPAVLVHDSNAIPGIVGNPQVERLSPYQSIKLINMGASQDFSKLAQEVVSLPFGRQANLDLEIHGNVEKLNEAQKALLQRSFSDCCSITVREMGAGFSADVVKVFAEFGQTGNSIHSIPFLAKFDKMVDVYAEITNYGIYIDKYVPYYLRPAIDIGRCICEQVWYQQEWGIIVSGYVDRSVSLLDAIRRGSGSAAIHSLFDDTLGRWLFNTRKETASPYLALQKGNPKTDRFDITKFDKNPEIFIKAKGFSRHVLKPYDLLKAIENIPCDSYLYGTCHNDLHAKNVLVRGNDAVIIDFPKCDTGPVLVDMATMDVSIAFDSIPMEAKYYKEWKSFLSDIFSPKYVLQVPPLGNAYDPFYNQRACIRQIRRLAFLHQTHKNEYMLCMAMGLMHRAMYLVGGKAKIPGYAYYLAHRLVKALK